MAQIPNEERETLILTSASRGIGHATVKRFSSAGWRVITCSRHGFPEDCPWDAGPEDHIQVDLADPDDTLKAVAVMKDRLKAQGGRLNALVSNAGLTREMAADFGPRGIRVNAISPGEIDTAILSPGTEKLIADIPMRRLGLPEEVAKAIYFLCTEQSSYINGAEISIDGGQRV